MKRDIRHDVIGGSSVKGGTWNGSGVGAFGDFDGI